MTTRYFVMLLASERTRQRIDDVLLGGLVGAGVFFVIRWMGWLG